MQANSCIDGTQTADYTAAAAVTTATYIVRVCVYTHTHEMENMYLTSGSADGPFLPSVARRLVLGREAAMAATMGQLIELS